MHTAFGTFRSRAQATGMLAGDGAQMLHSTVYTNVVPAQPPADLVGVVRPVLDGRGRVRDWSLDTGPTSQPLEDLAFERYRSWRATFADERFLGERALVRALLAWAAPRCDLPALAGLRLPHMRVDFHQALRVKTQIDRLVQVVAYEHYEAVGLYTPGGRGGPFRGFIPAEPATVLLTIGPAELSVAPGGLCFRIPGQGGSGLRGQSITGWRITDDAVLAQMDGEAVEFDGGADPAHVLHIAGREADEVTVRPCSLAALVAPILMSLRDSAQLAGAISADLSIRSGQP